MDSLLKFFKAAEKILNIMKAIGSLLIVGFILTVVYKGCSGSNEQKKARAEQDAKDTAEALEWKRQVSSDLASHAVASSAKPPSVPGNTAALQKDEPFTCTELTLFARAVVDGKQKGLPLGRALTIIDEDMAFTASDKADFKVLTSTIYNVNIGAGTAAEIAMKECIKAGKRKL